MYLIFFPKFNFSRLHNVLLFCMRKFDFWSYSNKTRKCLNIIVYFVPIMKNVFYSKIN